MAQKPSKENPAVWILVFPSVSIVLELELEQHLYDPDCPPANVWFPGS